MNWFLRIFCVVVPIALMVVVALEFVGCASSTTHHKATWQMGAFEI